jgi:hypothetical protein
VPLDRLDGPCGARPGRALDMLSAGVHRPLVIGNSFTPGCSYQWLPAPMGWGPWELLHHADRRFESYAGQKYPFAGKHPFGG